MTTATQARGDVSYPKFPLAVLFLLYLSQGLPYGFQKMALPLLLREQGASLSSIGFLGALALPWAFKALWAPLLDRFYSARFGRRKSWILPMQCLLLGSIGMAGFYGTTDLKMLLAAVFLMNLFAATQDIAVDGFAIDTLKPHALGLGNTAQVVGYKAGMIIAGGVLLSMTQTLGWGFLFAWMAALTLLPLAPLLFHREKPVPQDASDGIDADADGKLTLKEIVLAGFRLIIKREIRWAIALILSCKLGEEMVGTMFTTFLLDGGITRAQIGTWVASYGMAASVTGSIVGGVLITRMRVWRVLGLALIIAVVPLGMQWWLTQTTLTAENIIVTTVLEHVAAGMITTALFTFMMVLVQKRAGATEYTLLASLQVIGKLPAMGSGVIAEHYGYDGLFLIGMALSLVPIAFWWKCRMIAEA